MRIGIIGTNWGRMHIGGFRATGATIAAIAGSDADKTARIASEEGIPLGTTDVAALCEAVDVVVVASPDALHHVHAAQAIEAGRHVLCEKPLTRTSGDARTLAALARRHPELVCAVSFPYRALSTFTALRAMLMEREVAWVSVQVRSSMADLEGRAATGPRMGASGDFGGLSHIVDAVAWLCDTKAEWVQAQMLGRPAHSVAMHAGDRRFTWSIDHYAVSEPGIRGAWQFVGDGWEARVTAGYHPDTGWSVDAVEAWEEGAWRSVIPGSDPGTDPWVEAHATTARWMLSAVEGGDRGHLAGFDTGLMVQEVLNGAMRAAVRGSRISFTGR